MTLEAISKPHLRPDSSAESGIVPPATGGKALAVAVQPRVQLKIFWIKENCIVNLKMEDEDE